MQHRFYTYLVTNQYRKTLYTGMTNNMAERLIGHFIGNEKSFSTKYLTHYLVWFQETKYVINAIALEKELKRYSRTQKDALIKAFNPEWRFLNEEVVGNWPPTMLQVETVKEKWARNAQRWW